MNRPSRVDADRTRAFWAAGKPSETSAPAYVADPPLWWHVLLALAAALVLQASFAPLLAFRGGTPPLVLLLVGWYALRTGSLHGFTFGLIAGAAEDALAGNTGVAWTFATALAGLAAGRLARTWLADTIVVLVPGAAALTLGRYGAFAIAMQAQGRSLPLPIAHLHVVLWQSALASLAAFALLRLSAARSGGARF